ncbi:ABC transporter permease [Afifella pfennigii]|uniref:ABC transporter permease n=1 Tax=Afifella pfennigii TaxID=209897 RepID=UPI0004799735|nr:ABC transporter permease [Afifella pfennigii]
MSLFAFIGALETGLLFSLVALGVFLSFRVLDFPDLTVDGSFPLGAAVAAAALAAGVDPFLATGLAILAGWLAGLVTATLNVRFGIMNLLAGILTMVALFSINLRIMGGPNVPLYNVDTVFDVAESWIDLGMWTNVVLIGIFAIGAKLISDWFLKTEIGLALRASGENPAMAEAQGIAVGRMALIGMALSNGFVALAGALFAQLQGVADVSMGIGTIVTGLAALIIGEAILGRRMVFIATLGCIIGALVYRLFIAMSLSAGFIGIEPQDLNLVTAIVVAIAVILSKGRAQRSRRKAAAAPARTVAASKRAG